MPYRVHTAHRTPHKHHIMDKYIIIIIILLFWDVFSRNQLQCDERWSVDDDTNAKTNSSWWSFQVHFLLLFDKLPNNFILSGDAIKWEILCKMEMRMIGLRTEIFHHYTWPIRNSDDSEIVGSIPCTWFKLIMNWNKLRKWM